MILQTLMAYSPFLGLLYLTYALFQALRKKQQGFGAALLALIALAAPAAALFLMTGVTARSMLVNTLTLNAVIVFVGSLVVRRIEKRNPARAANRSYGMLGIGLGVLLALGTFAAPLITTVSASGTAAGTTAETTAATDPTLLTVSNTTGDTGSETGVVEVLTAQTGLTSDELTAQLQSGSTIAQLVAAHEGDLQAVIAAAASALDELKTAGGMPAQMLANLGSDSTDIATQFVNGELNSRAQRFLNMLLVSGNSGFPPAAQALPSGDGTPSAPTGFSPLSADGTLTSPDGFAPPLGSDAQDTAANPADENVASETTSQPTETPQAPTATVVRPTQIVFPSATPSPAVSETPIVMAANAGVICAITINYNLNLREAPNTDSTVLLSIPFGSIVQADGRSAEGWYHVSYDGKSGWVSGDYVTSASTCDDLAVTVAE